MQINEHRDTGTFNKLNFNPTSTKSHSLTHYHIEFARCFSAESSM